MRNMKWLAIEAIQVQDACNLLGVSKGFADTLLTLKRLLETDGLPNDTDAIRSHCITRLWASKIHDLAGMGLSDTEHYGAAYEECRKLAEMDD